MVIHKISLEYADGAAIEKRLYLYLYEDIQHIHSRIQHEAVW